MVLEMKEPWLIETYQSHPAPIDIGLLTNGPPTGHPRTLTPSFQVVVPQVLTFLIGFSV